MVQAKHNIQMNIKTDNRKLFEFQQMLTQLFGQIQ